MTPLSQLECCTLLGIDPKTLCQWMRQAHLQFAPHPTDARLTCLTHQQVQQVAAQHGHPLRLPTPAGLPASLPFAPDSPEWFDWLATLTSFRFIGKPGRFHARRDTRGGQHTRGFRAYRIIHQHLYRHDLGTTDRLTLAALEHVASTLQAHGDARYVVESGHALTSSCFRTRATGVGAHLHMELMRQECAC